MRPLNPGHLAFFALVLMLTATCVSAQPITLENVHTRLEVDQEHGRILRVLDKESSIDLTTAASLAENFRLLLRMPDKKTVAIMGKDQKLSSHRVAGDLLILRWHGPLRDVGGVDHRISVQMNIRAIASGLEFRLYLTNSTQFKVQEACYPFIGGLSKFGHPGVEPDGVTWVPLSQRRSQKIELPFGEHAFGYPGQLNMSYACVQSPSAKRSLYISSQDYIARYKTYHFVELAGDSEKDVAAYIKHQPFTEPGKNFTGSPIVFKFIDGDHRAAGMVYREWFVRTFGVSKPEDCWIRRQSFFQMIMFMLPEGTITYKFKDIPQMAKDAKDHGINSFMISGWHLGGHDNGYPYYTIDPRLGTWKELEDGIKAAHRLGVKCYFFVNYQAVMVDSDWYKRELQNYREHKEDGGLTWLAGWPMGTLYGRMDHPKLMTWADPAFPEYRKIIVDQFERLAKIGADGVHVDKMFPATIEWNPNVPMSPDTATWEGAIILTKEIMAACRKHKPDWAMSFECRWDRMIQFGGATWWVGNQLVTRTVFPEHAETLGLANAFDYLGVNNCVRDGHIGMVCPQNFTRTVGWRPFKGLAEYIKEVKRIQDSLADAVFFGESLGHEQITLEGRPQSGVGYNVWRSLKTGKHVCIFTNSTMDAQRLGIKSLGGASGKVRIHTPFRKAIIVNLPARVEMPTERIVFVEQLGGAR